MIVTDTYSDHDMQCPAAWENGFKEGLVKAFGDATRQLSHPVTGDYVASTFNLQVIDKQRVIRERLASVTDRYWTAPLTIRMTSRANRAVFGTPFTVFVGPIIDAQPTASLLWDVTLGDLVGQSILSDLQQIPWRTVGDGFVDEITVDEHLDLDTPDPIIYGIHRRVPDIDPASPQGFEFTPIYLGREMTSLGDSHVWLVAGHACADLPDIFVNFLDPDTGDPVHQSVIADEGIQWLVPHSPGWTADYTTPYRDRRSRTYGNLRRYTLIYGKVTDLTADPTELTDPDACALGQKTLTVAVEGVELNADGTGAVITDRIDQYKHFLINYVANRGSSSYQFGDWLSNPTWEVFGVPVEIVDTLSFDVCKSIAQGRLPAVGSPATDAGYIGAAVIGARPGERSSVKRWLAEWNRSCGVRFGVTHIGQMRIVMLHPTEAIKEAAPLLTDAYEILQGSFNTTLGWDQHANRIPFRADYNHTTGVWVTTDTFSWADSITKYKRAIDGEQRDYLFAPGITAASHLARMDALVLKDPPRAVALESTIGPDVYGWSLAYLDLGDYFRYRHFDAVSTAKDQIRLAQVTWHQVQAGKRRVKVEAIDCEDLIGFDAPVVYDDATGSPGSSPGSPESANETCSTGLLLGDLATPFEGHFDTTLNATDGSVSGFGDTLTEVAYHAAWFTFTAPADNILNVNTFGSDYDTQLAVFTGDCGDLVLEYYNDNQEAYGLITSQVVMTVTSGTTYHILVAGRFADDAGHLQLNAFLT